MKLEFKYTTAIVNNLIKIEKYKTNLEFMILPTREKQKLIYDGKLKKTHFSTSIEGNILSYNQVKNVINDKNDSTRIKAEQEVLNYWDALTYLEEAKKDNLPVTKELIFKIHDYIERKGKLTHIDFRGPTPPGILFAVYDSKTRMPEYIPPEACDIDGLVDYIIDWYNHNSNLPTPIRAAIMNYALVSIHPFEDGNGRTSRVLANYILMLDNYDFKGFNSLEEYYMLDLNGYYENLQMGLPALYYDGRENPPHLEIWIEYFTKIMAINAERVYDIASEVQRNKDNYLLFNLNKRDLTLIRYCLENKIEVIKNKEIATLFGVTPRAISKWAKEWISKEILVPVSGTERITAYTLNKKYANLKISEIGFIY